tara:strand:- start:4846 stop:5322 length:477 start_codon:yes stop_codon:yes gene_type:complete
MTPGASVVISLPVFICGDTGPVGKLAIGKIPLPNGPPPVTGIPPVCGGRGCCIIGFPNTGGLIGIGAGIGSGCIVGGTNGIDSPTGKDLSIIPPTSSLILLMFLGGNPIGRLGILGNSIAGPRGSEGVNFGGIVTFGRMPALSNLALKLLNKPITNSV